jgi:hypothetical protein
MMNNAMVYKMIMHKTMLYKMMMYKVDGVLIDDLERDAGTQTCSFDTVGAGLAFSQDGSTLFSVLVTSLCHSWMVMSLLNPPTATENFHAIRVKMILLTCFTNLPRLKTHTA